MSARPPHHDIATISREGFDEEDIQAIEAEAVRLGVSFDDACKAMLLQLSRDRRNKPRPTSSRQLLRFSLVH